MTKKQSKTSIKKKLTCNEDEKERRERQRKLSEILQQQAKINVLQPAKYDEYREMLEPRIRI